MSGDFRFFEVDLDRLEGIFKGLRESLEKRVEIVFAIVFGGVIERSFVRDVDLAIYLNSKLIGDEVDAAVYSERLSKELSDKLGIPIDVVVLNFAPMWLRRRILRGRVLIDRDQILRLSLKLAVMDNLVERFTR